MIKVTNLNFSYNNTKPYILSNLSINLPKGAYVSVLGGNGSAKSTFVKLLLKLLLPTEGIIDISTKNIGYVPQRLDTFNSQFPITVYELLNTHRKAIKVKDKASIDKVLLQVSMLDFKNKLIGNLSGGQQQKIFIARALLGEPDLLILDEPSTGIDIKSQVEIYNIIKDYNVKRGITVISVEHNIKAAIDNSSHILTIENSFGRLYPINDFKKSWEEKNA